MDVPRKDSTLTSSRGIRSTYRNRYWSGQVSKVERREWDAGSAFRPGSIAARSYHGRLSTEERCVKYQRRACPPALPHGDRPRGCVDGLARQRVMGAGDLGSAADRDSPRVRSDPSSPAARRFAAVSHRSSGGRDLLRLALVRIPPLSRPDPFRLPLLRGAAEGDLRPWLSLLLDLAHREREDLPLPGGGRGLPLRGRHARLSLIAGRRRRLRR